MLKFVRERERENLTLFKFCKKEGVLCNNALQPSEKGGKVGLSEVTRGG